MLARSCRRFGALEWQARNHIRPEQENPRIMTPASKLDSLVAELQREVRAGRLAQAAEVCRRIVRIRPNLAEVHNDLGTLLAQQGRLAEAIAPFERAIGLKPDFAIAHNNLGLALKDLGRLDQAVAQFRQAVALQPDLVQTHDDLGTILLGQGKLDEAAACFERVLALVPGLAAMHGRLGLIRWQQDQFAEAAAHFEHALALAPQDPEAHTNLAKTLWKQGQLEQAAARFRQALAIQPDFVPALHNLGNLHLSQGQFEQAQARFEQTIAVDPGHAAAHNDLAMALWKQGHADAATWFQRALALKPDYADAYNNFGMYLSEHDRPGEAVTHFEQAIALAPNSAGAHHNLASTLLNQDQVDAAAARFEQALAIEPDLADAHAGLATCLLTSGNYERGWREYEWRLRVPERALPPLGPPRWQGEPLAGRRLLLYAEQGLGDTLQFIRYARLFKERGARVVLAVPAALGPLLASHPDVDELLILGVPHASPPCDFHLPSLSAPLALGTTAATIPAVVPYLSPDAALADHWRQELAAIEGFKIGVVWQGSRTYGFDRLRSFPLAQLAPLARLPGVRLVSLQKGFGSEQVAGVDFPLLDLAGRLDEQTGPFLDTAAVIAGLDLVVAPDTAIAHLAGALGTPVWVALQFSPDWRWLRGQDDTPWYPTMRLFRQTRFNHWPDVFQRMAEALRVRFAETA